ncbi:hypothetical protein [Sphingosinicella sp.]|uniref:hypothetical protein n=1 Tax=Sphingosinicella sp. TaxID=1917971 RepID=UPI004037796C
MHNLALRSQAADRSILAGAGAAVFAAGLVGMGAFEALLAEPLAPFHTALGPGAGAQIAGVLLCLLSLLASPLVPLSNIARLALACFWLASLALLAAGAGAEFGVPNLVAASQALLLAAAAFCIGRGGIGSARLLRGAFSATLILFGGVHLLYRSAIAAMIPAWIPFAEWGPWLTGATMIAAGVASLLPSLVHHAALVVVCLFASWLPLIHTGRLIANPSSVAEWTFALMAVSLTGAAMIVASLPRRHLSR